MTIDRRSFLKATAAQAAILGVGATGCAKRHPGAAAIPRSVNPFRHGVASGDPLTDRVILWTRVSPFEDRIGEPVETYWWIARDSLGLDVVAGGTVQALPEKDYTVKVDATGLEAGTDYHYGFLTQTGLSTIGRTRTLPRTDVDHVRMAFASCANYPTGFFNAYACLAERDDVDVILHLGDYLYEYGNGEYGDGTSLGRIPDPLHEVLTLEDYRRRHATYKADPDLQAAHARHPWITIWDDHETANNSHPEGAKNHDPATEGDWQTRKLAGIRAYYEWMPIRELPTGLFRSFRFGDLVDLVMLDTRLHGRDPEVKPKDEAAASDPSRTLLGEDQKGWLFDALSDSQRAGSAWRVIGQQIMVAPVSFGRIKFNPDSWNGYRASRARVLDYLHDEGIDNVVFLTGDVHSSWVFDIPAPPNAEQQYDPATGAGSRAIEFVAPAVSSPPLGASRDWGPKRQKALDRTPHLKSWYAAAFEAKSDTNNVVRVEDDASGAVSAARAIDE